MTQQQLRMIEQLDQLDRLDHEEFMELNEQANSCVLSHDFTCAENKMAKAQKLANSSSEKNLLLNTRRNLQNERQRIADEEHLRAQEERRLAEAEEEMQRAQRRAQEADEDRGPSTAEQIKLFGDLFAQQYANNLAEKRASMQLANEITRKRNAEYEASNNRLQESFAKQKAQIEADRIARNRLEQQRQAAFLHQQQLAKASQVESPKFVPQTIVIPTGRTQCPPGSSPARQKNAQYVTIPPEAYCIKDSSNDRNIPLTFNTNTSVQDNSKGQKKDNNNQSGNSLENTKKNNFDVDGSSMNQKKKEIQMGPIQLEAIAICRQSQKTKKWECNGALDNQIIVDEPTLQSALSRQHCTEGTWAAGGPILKGVQWEAYRCGHALGYGDYDVAKRYGLITARRSYQCVKGQPGDGRCAVFYGN